MLWIVIILLIYVATFVFVSFKVLSTRNAVEKSHKENLERVSKEKKEKQSLLQSIAMKVIGLTTPEAVTKATEDLSEFDAIIAAEKGKQAIAEAEIETLDIRLRELEELRRELEVSNMDAVKEVEMLKAQERDMSNKNLGIQDQLKNSFDQIEILVSMLSGNANAVEQLNKAKSELEAAEKSISFYEGEITKINTQYVALKRAYDALDIEYAQLYEKRQQQGN